MSPEDFSLLKRTHIVRREGEFEAFMVDACYGEYMVVVNTVMVSSPQEWLVNGQPLTVVQSLRLGDQLTQRTLPHDYPLIVTSCYGKFAFAAAARMIDKTEAAFWERITINT